MELVIDQLWECPRCLTQVGGGSPAILRPPRCSCNGGTEMEQVTVERWGRQFGGEPDHG